MQGRKNAGTVKRKERCMSNDFTGEMSKGPSDLAELYPGPCACASNYSSGVLQDEV